MKNKSLPAKRKKVSAACRWKPFSQQYCTFQKNEKKLDKATVQRTTQNKTMFPADECTKRQYFKVAEPR